MINNRDLSWLAFNERVLQEAQDKSVPLLQRLRFLGIFSNNQDEFIKVRVANIVRLSQMRGKKQPFFSGGYLAKELLPLVNTKVYEGQKKFSNIYAEVLSEMETQGIYVINEKQLNKRQKQFCHEYFSSVVSPLLVPLIIRKTTQLPFLRDNAIYHAVKMYAGKHSQSRYAIIQIPVSSSCPRFVVLPSSVKDRNEIIFLDDIIRFCLDEIFFMFNYKTVSAYTFKLMRDAQLTLDDDISKSLVEKMEAGLEGRLHGQPVRLIYDKEMPQDMLDILATKLKLKDRGELDAGGRYHLMRDLMKFPKVRLDLESQILSPLHHPDIKVFSSILKVIAKKDILLNYPYHTFNHFIDFLREAAIDPKVESIYITLYRTAERSKVINTLINAAKNGKKVVVLLELLARFDEEQNVEYSELLQKEGVKVIHGVNGLKVHGKLVLIERKGKDFVYIGTGNFNENTAQIYSDFGLFTSNPQIASDARSVFDFLVNTHRHFTCKQLMVSPYYMRDQFYELIKKEIKNAQSGKKAYIYAKFNSLTDEDMINMLYKASQAGVDIRLIIRGACCLQPQVKGLSENIRVISIVDRYLEHARLAIFYNNGEEKVYALSADWMTRNLDRRVEVAIPIIDNRIKQNLLDFFNIQWSDNEKARDLAEFGENNYITRGDNPPCRSQLELYSYYKNMK
ncbi:polyphosphate kinase 1 [Dysgonomonas sp. BGC7]|uniref:polyphosphate kinase 1 n=1 Tax=Dysgonomonas sp. BGC7 TaxID=1658008 RepID=UPI000682E4FD|nr:polyphosphate kinase 1 [Dysgonomonas sp. BGC7]MBD8389484.1 polyphosphate kinase 1 [Dysgonomonas sp. BGC7]